MTERFNALTVVLERDTREDDAQAIIDAIKQLRGVASVKGNVADVESLVAQERAVQAMRQKLIAVLFPQEKP